MPRRQESLRKAARRRTTQRRSNSAYRTVETEGFKTERAYPVEPIDGLYKGWCKGEAEFGHRGALRLLQFDVAKPCWSGTSNHSQVMFSFHSVSHSEICAIFRVRHLTVHIPSRRYICLHQRVVAVAGDQVVVRRGLLYVNKKPARSFPSVSYFGWSSRRCATNSQALTDERHSRTPASYTWGPTIVPKGHVIVLGDYRDASFDSHIWGPLPVQNVIGYARARIWPMRRVAWFPLNPPP